jgi:hypothetical protein
VSAIEQAARPDPLGTCQGAEAAFLVTPGDLGPKNAPFRSRAVPPGGPYAAVSTPTTATPPALVVTSPGISAGQPGPANTSPTDPAESRHLLTYVGER